MFKGKGEEEKLISRNIKILRDFPWLWGVRGEWNRSLANIAVKNIDGNKDFFNFLCSYPQSTMREVWVYHGVYPKKYAVTKADLGGLPDNYARKILDTLFGEWGELILGVAVLENPEILDAVKVTVFRLKNQLQGVINFMPRLKAVASYTA